MRISKQPSGGRGEYEIAENAPNGLRPIDVLNRDILLDIGDFKIYTGVQLKRVQGKRRLRRNENTYPQVHIQVANMLLLPHPVRDEENMVGGQPVLQSDRYIIKHINFGDVDNNRAGSFTARVRTIECANQAYQADEINVTRRMGEIERVWEGRQVFPPDIANLLAQHERFVRGAQPNTGTRPIPSQATALVRSIQEKLVEYADDLNVVYPPHTDLLPALLAVMNEVDEEPTVLLDQIEPDQIELRRREQQRWRQYVNRRGAPAVRFKRRVREAYDYCCVVCGNRFPPTSVNARPGIDAAHILPWSVYDLDEVYNGLALCKIHHWAFDEGLLRITHQDGRYSVEISEEADETLYEPLFSIDALRQVLGPIPEERLPAAHALRPRPDILRRLEAEGL